MKEFYKKLEQPNARSRITTRLLIFAKGVSVWQYRFFSHNAEAYETAIAMLAETGKATIIHPTGTGMSFIGFKLCEDNPDAVVCWEPNEAAWQDGYARAKEYYRTYGDLDVPASYTDAEGFKLGAWIANKRTLYRKKLLSEMRIAQLE